MPGAHVRPTPAGVRVSRAVVGVLIVTGIAAAGVRAGLGEAPGDRISAARSAEGDDPTPRAAPDVGQDRLDRVRREWFLLPEGAMPPRAAMPAPGLPTSAPPTSDPLPRTAAGTATTAAPTSRVPPDAGSDPPALPLPPGSPGPHDGPDDEAHQVPPAFDGLRPAVPPRALAAYRSAAASLRTARPSCRLDWALLAAIGTVESDHGRFGGARLTTAGAATPPILGIRLDGTRAGTATVRDSDGGRLDGDPVYDRAVGPMQFLPGTWAVYGRSATPGKPADPQDIDDAALSAGWYLCAAGRNVSDAAQRRAAVLAYNPSDTYAGTVLALSRTLAGGPTPPLPAPPPATPSPATPTPATPPPVTPTATPTPTTPTPTTPTPTPTSPPTTSGPVTPTSPPSTTTTSPPPDEPTPTDEPTTTPTGEPTAPPTPTGGPTTAPDEPTPTTTPSSSTSTSTTTSPSTSTSTTTSTTTTTTTSSSDETPTDPSASEEPGVTASTDPTEPGRVTVTWVPFEVDVTVRLERRDEEGDWQVVGDPDHRHVAPGEDATATWDHLAPGDYRAVLDPRTEESRASPPFTVPPVDRGRGDAVSSHDSESPR